jgi:hypothetical protein
LDQKLGLSRGTIYDLCLGSMKSKTESKSGVRVTFRGESERSGQPPKAVFLIEYKIVRAGEEVDRVVQVHLEM